MCFAPEADIVAGAVIGVISIDVIRHHPQRRDYALAALPPLLAAHSLIESLVWYADRDQVSETLGSLAAFVYILIAFVVLPTFVPLAIRSRETSQERRRLLAATSVVGVFVSAMSLWSLVVGPIEAQIEDYFIDYNFDLAAPYVVVPLYVVATCGAALLSSSRHILIFGVVNLAAVLVLGWFLASGLASLWCGWATVTSIAIALFVRRDERLRRLQRA